MAPEIIAHCKLEYDHQMVKYISSHHPSLTAYLSDTNYQSREEHDDACDCDYMEFYCVMEGHKYTQLFRIKDGQVDVLTDIIDTLNQDEAE
ncbi:MAG: hypothetical protein J6Z12_02440 [Paludibacteraceae bacterium]|nr:hypothetical protein [Paludibacteraceae bacterium]